MKNKIHPEKYLVTVTCVDGSTIEIETTNSSLANQNIKLDQDPSTNPAWTGKFSDSSRKRGKAEMFHNKFSGFKINE